MRTAAPGHLDPLDEPERLGRSFTISLVFHAAMGALLLFGAVLHVTKQPFMGSPNVGGGVEVTAVRKIPIPEKAGQINHLANNTESVVPQEPLKLREQRPPAPKQVEKAIELPTKTPPKVVPPRQSNPVQYRPKQEYAKNQVFTKTPEALKSAQIGLTGSGGVGIAPNSVFGYQFGAYAQQIRDLIASKWNTAGISASPQVIATVSIRISRDGSVNISNVQTSGSYTLDSSAKRAVLDANPLPPLPPNFPRSQADVDLLFQLRR